MSTTSPPSAAPASAGLPVLVVGLERTVVRTDLLLEAAFAEVRRSPTALARMAGWALGGRLKLGQRLAAHFEPSALPYREELIERLRTERARGRRVVLVSNSEGSLVDAVAAHLGVFDTVVAPRAAQSDLGESVSARLDRDFPRHERLEASADPSASIARAALKALRPHQWTKNLLVLVPAVLAHALQRGEVIGRGLLAFAAFSLCASSVYVLNDLLDLHADRAHHRKRKRPFASGSLPLGFGLVLAPALLAGALALSVAFLPPAFLVVLSVYYAATVAYSLVLKRLVIIDVLLLAGLYTVRMLAGAAAYDVRVSQWLLAFSLFIFLSLAFVKRYSELWVLRKSGVEESKGRGYRASDLEQLSSLGSAAGYLSVLVLALYVNSADVTRLYSHPERLWGILPVMLFWISRVWLLASRGQMHDDPIVFAIRDRASYAVAAIAAAIVWWAI